MKGKQILSVSGLMSSTRFLQFTLGILVFLLESVGFCSATNDIASPDQSTRDAAAKVLRSAWVPPARTNWDSLLATITNGIPRTNIVIRLQKINATPEGAFGGGGTITERYRLDDLWLLECYFKEAGVYPLLGKSLIKQVKDVRLAPPSDFSGIWTTYWINGQRAAEIHCANGKYQGEFTGFYSDGKRAYVQHYDNGRANGPDTGFFPSGHIRYRGILKDDKEIGIWIWYNDDGSTNSVRDYSKQ